MCLHPIRVSKETCFYKFNDHTNTFIRRIPYVCGNDYALGQAVRPYRFSHIIVPCGKCLECLRTKQNDLAARVAIEAAKRGSMHFLTLTYDWQHVPLSYCLRMVDKDTGEVFTDFTHKVINREFLFQYKRCISRKRGIFDYVPKYPDFFAYHRKIRDELCHLPKGPKARVLSVPYNKDMASKLFPTELVKEFCQMDIPEYLDDDLGFRHVPDLPFFDDDYYYYIDFTLSLDRRDVRLWIKRCRVKYERKFGCKLSPFSYVVCGEFGPRTCRPHYHVAFMGLSDQEAAFMASEWSMGNVHYKRVDRVQRKNGKVIGNGFVAAGKYIGKYMSKGVFECDSVQAGLAQKPRLLTSIDFGIEGDRRIETVMTPKGSYQRERFDLPTRVISFYRCYDVFGHYDLNTFVSVDDIPMTITDIERLHKLVLQRNKYTVEGQEFRVPKIVLKRVWYECQEKSHRYEKPTLVRRALQSFIQTDLVEDYIGKYFDCHPEASREDACVAYHQGQAVNAKSDVLKEQSYERSLREFFGKSKF